MFLCVFAVVCWLACVIAKDIIVVLLVVVMRDRTETGNGQQQHAVKPPAGKSQSHSPTQAVPLAATDIAAVTNMCLVTRQTLDH